MSDALQTVFSASPRPQGNSAFAAKMVADILQTPSVISLAEYPSLPCTACDYCVKHEGLCRITKQEQDIVDDFYQRMFVSENIFFVSPIYFYHVPAQLKIFMDRAQAYYFAPKDKRKGLGQKCNIILLGAREQGEKLFEGATLSFKYFFDALGFKLNESLYLYGLDKADDLKNSPEAQKSVRDFVLTHKN